MEREVGLKQLHVPGEGEPIHAEYEPHLEILITCAAFLITPSIVFVHGMDGNRHDSWTKKLGKRNISADDDRPAVNAASGNASKIGKLMSSLHLRRKGHIKRSSSPQATPETAAKASTSARAEVFWPRDLLPNDVPSCRIYTWGYNVDIRYFRASTSTATISDHSRTLVFDLARARRSKEEESRPIIFVAHSLGGVVVKQALNLSSTESGSLKALCHAVYGICFLGTPHRGSPKADLIETLNRLSKLWGNIPNTKITQLLLREAETLRLVHDSFIKNPLTEEMKICTFHEGLDTKGITIVDRFSSTIGLRQEEQSDIPADHVNMAKFESPTDEGYVRLTGVLSRWVDGIRSSCGQDCLNSLQNTERSSRVHQVAPSYKDTYSWLFSDIVGFTKWLKEPNCARKPIFYIQGKPGSGKSTLIKFALHDSRTQPLLQSSHEASWSLIPFFFHDRGSDVQKTVSGLLQEILYQLLDKYPRLVPLVVHIRLNLLRNWLSGSGILAVSGGGDAGVFDSQWRSSDATEARQVLNAVEREKKRLAVMEVPWQPSDVDKALEVIMHQSEVPLNCLLFVDALDEHSGDHQKLLDALMRFTTRDGSGAARIKLCLAGRPETFFRITLKSCPGFAIQDYTKADIETYTFGRLESVFNLQDREYDLRTLEQLAKEVTQKAEGVFIWVKLVVEELLEAITDGSSITQLRRILSTIPAELGELYQRIIQKRKPAYIKEAYIMFQLVLHAFGPLSLESLMAATDVAMGEQWDRASEESMRRRLLSRCGGLLELVSYKKTDVYADESDWESDDESDDDDEGDRENNGDPEDGVSEDGARYKSKSDGNHESTAVCYTVQLIHQTFKEFLQKPNNATLGLSFPGQNPKIDGKLYLLRFGANIATEMKTKEVERHFIVLKYFFDYARKVERAGVSVISEIDSLLKTSAAGDINNRKDGLGVLENLRAGRWASMHPDPTCLRRNYDLVSKAAAWGCCSYVMYKVAGGVPVSLPQCRPLIMAVLPGIVSLTDQDLEESHGLPEALKLLDLLLAKGLDVNCDWEGIKPLSELLRSLSYPDRMLLFLEYLLKHGADPNKAFAGKQMHLLSIYLSSLDSYDISSLLLQYGLDPMLKDEDGNTILIRAICYENERVIELLCQHGADPTELGNGVNALEPETFPEFLELVEEYERKDCTETFRNSAVKMYDMLLYYSDPKNRGLAKKVVTPDISSAESHEDITVSEEAAAISSRTD